MDYYEEYRQLGLNIKFYRNDVGYTQAELAEKLSIEYTHLSRIERAKGSPSLDTVFAISKALNVPVCKLFEFRD